MVGFGVVMGQVFPFIVQALVPGSVSTLGFRAACLVAGIAVGVANYALARAVVGRRLGRLAARMRDVGDIVRAATKTGDWTALNAASCVVDVDSDEELGEPAAAFNTVIEALRDSVTQRRRLEDRLRHQTLHDPLTGLANRSLFFNRVEHDLDRARRHNGTVTVMYIDLDGFKVINDTWGHEFGDLLLVQVARRLKDSRRRTDTVARLGGDEFAVLLEDMNPAAADALALKLNEVLRVPYTVGGEHVRVGASVGVAIGTAETESPQALVQLADAAMYEAKRDGRDRHRMAREHVRRS